jgi:hypothetical protein
MLVIVKSHDNPMFDAQNPWKSHKTSGSKNQIWDGWTLLLTLDRPDGAQTVATENRQGTLLWRTMSLGNLRGRSVFSFFLGTHQSLAGLKWCETHRWSFLDTAFSSVFFFNAPVLEECVSCSSWNGSQEYEITGITSLWSHPQNGRFHLLSVWFFPMFLCLPSDRYGTSNHICSKDVFTLW